ncbi:uncharacterized protein C7orf31-like isoform X1 [Lytechinus variegatus]|uniref:uncharacterized protein C7orf31-like isoform X1 n=1 Tax=Lytechinus variegatus TaxID=7654 RepID=UPI001BB179A1|nr:uncharacterized protein C7orf31-like isoform X1 [Lytechinus variegatus]
MTAAISMTNPASAGPLGVAHYYREPQGLDTLSRKFQSSELFTPFQVPQRSTISVSRYSHYRDALDKHPRVPWGTAREYGGEGPINLPDDHRPKSEPPPAVEKGHRHFGAGVNPYPRGIPIDQYYDLTLLKRSNIRSNDQLLPRPTEVDMTKLSIDKPFPAEHPYSSHMSRFAMFPSFASTPDDYKTGEAARQQQPLHPEIPANPNDITINYKSKGARDRVETEHIPLDSQKKALSWPGDTFFQNKKTPTSGQQQFYPIPPKAVLPNHAPRKLDHTLNPRTANALRNVERSQWTTTYNRAHTGYGPANALALDNLEDKLEMEKKLRIEDHSLKPRSYPTFMPPRPLEGRISRLIGPNQMVRCVVKDGRILYVPYYPKIDIEMDKVREHKNLPTETTEQFQDPALTQQWKRLQAAQHPDGHISKIEEKKREAAEDADPANTLPIGDNSYKPVEKVKESTYLQEMAVNRRAEIEDMAQKSRWKQAELQEHHHDLSELKRKVDYTTPSLQKSVYYDNLHKIYTTKPPFYYDGDNPYEYDYVTPWDYHKTSAMTDQYKIESHVAKIREKVQEKMDAQFPGIPGRNPYVMPKYTQEQLMNGRPRTVEGEKVQKPIPQSTYVYSYTPENMKTIVTPDQPRFDLWDATRPLPQIYNSNTTTSSSDDKIGSPSKQVSISNTVKVANGGNEEPLRTHEQQLTSHEQMLRTSTNAPTEPAALNPGSNPVVDARHTNPEGNRDWRFDWSPGYALGPRPQTTLLKQQNSFTKTGTRREFNNTFPETNPDLRDNIFDGKKHEFQGENAFSWH